MDRITGAIALLWLLGGCTSPGGRLIDNTTWSPLDPADDPLPSHRPDGAHCDDGSWYEEGGNLEVLTDTCSYLELSQPLLLDVHERDTIRIEGFHEALYANPPAQAHMALIVGDTVLWEYFADIPSDADVFTTTVDPPRAMKAGEPIIVHLHNHGANTWDLVSVDVTRPGEPEPAP